jgi:hypothetical protein
MLQVPTTLGLVGSYDLTSTTTFPKHKIRTGW